MTLAIPIANFIAVFTERVAIVNWCEIGVTTGVQRTADMLPAHSFSI